MKKSLLSAMILAAAMAAPAAAQEEEEEMEAGNIARSFYVEIKPGHGDQFYAGWDAYWACYRENGGTQSWSAWVPQTGKLGAVLFRSGGHHWADFDQQNPAGEACEDVFDTVLTPNMGAVYSGFSQGLPDVSRYTEDPINLVMTIDIDVNDYGAAMEVISAWHEALVAAEWGKYAWSANVTSSQGWDLTLVLFNENYADMAPGERNFNEIVVAHHGEEKAAELNAQWNANVKRSRSRLWRRSAALSYTAE